MRLIDADRMLQQLSNSEGDNFPRWAIIGLIDSQPTVSEIDKNTPPMQQDKPYDWSFCWESEWR